MFFFFPSHQHNKVSFFKMLVPITPILLLLSSALAAPSNEAPQLSFNLADSTQTGFFTSLAYQISNSLLSSVGLASSTLVNEYGLQPKDETKTIWKAINENEHFSRKFFDAHKSSTSASYHSFFSSCSLSFSHLRVGSCTQLLE